MRWQGQCPECAEWNTLVQEAAEVTSIFAAKHNLQGGGRRIELVGLDHPAALPAYRHAGFTACKRAIERFRDPRLTGILPLDCAPQVPLLGTEADSPPAS